MAYDWNWASARREYERAIELNPNSAECHFEYGWYLMCLGQFDEGIREMQTAVELEPASPFFNRNLGFYLYFTRQYDRAIEQLQKTLDLDPNYVSVYGWLGDSYLMKGDYDRAVEAYLKGGYDGSEGNPKAIKAMREAYETRGWRGYQQKRVELMEDRAKKGYIRPDSIAIFY
ncbi:MAG TPA: tetratricopeptide repeat protein, partial [Blastocatellia bacterium]|nr:tetratricopeptide repeat protein [Blastocatellia bacterium]